MGQKKKNATGERRQYIRYACKAEFKAIIDFNPDVARRSMGKLPPIVFRRGERVTVRNVGEKGISIEGDRIMPEGLILKISLENPVTPPIQTGARIIWVKKRAKGKSGYVMGLAFRYIREKHRRNLEKLIEFLQSIPD